MDGRDDNEKLSPSDFDSDLDKSTTDVKKKPSKIISSIGIVVGIGLMAFLIWNLLPSSGSAEQVNDDRALKNEPQLPLQLSSKSQLPVSSDLPQKEQILSVTVPNESSDKSGQQIDMQKSISNISGQNASAPHIDIQNTEEKRVKQNINNKQMAIKSEIVGEKQDVDISKIQNRVDVLEKRMIEIHKFMEGSVHAAKRNEKEINKRKKTINKTEKNNEAASKKIIDNRVPNKIESAVQDGTSMKLKAVLEGRAWLQDRTGATLTVAPGDTIPGVGVVRTIDADNGIVFLTNGKQLK
jgi:hypothetical protein